MKPCTRNLFLLPTLLAGFGLIQSGQATAQTYTALYSFTADQGPFPNTNSDGSHPEAGLVLSSNILYGTANQGGISGKGTVFALKADGNNFTNLHSFTAIVNPGGINSDGANPYAGLILSDNSLYGTAASGGSFGGGTVFKINTNGTDFTNLHSFTGLSDGATPLAKLILSGNTLYGTAAQGGSSGNGTVFKVNTNGTGFTTLHSFTATVAGANSDGVNPYAGLILSGNTLYGTTLFGGSWGNGTVFKVNTNGTGFANLHNFTGGNDGGDPTAGLILLGNTLYGTSGSVFAINTDGTGFIGYPGLNPFSGADLFSSGNTLYGTTLYGGSSENGTVFSLSLPPPPPQLTIIPYGANVILTWPTNATGFDLQSTTNLVSQSAWSTVSPAPVVVNGQNTVTNFISGSQKFYRLSQ